MLFMDTINETSLISYVCSDQVHTANLDDIVGAVDRLHSGEVTAGPHPFHRFTEEVPLGEWAATGHMELDESTIGAEQFDAIAEWADWLDEVIAEAEARGDDDTELAREFVGYLFASDIAAPQGAVA